MRPLFAALIMLGTAGGCTSTSTTSDTCPPGAGGCDEPPTALVKVRHADGHRFAVGDVVRISVVDSAAFGTEAGVVPSQEESCTLVDSSAAGGTAVGVCRRLDTASGGSPVEASIVEGQLLLRAQFLTNFTLSVADGTGAVLGSQSFTRQWRRETCGCLAPVDMAMTVR